MSDDSERGTKVTVGTGGGWIAIALLIIAFYGEPDLIDAIIFALMGPQS